MRLLFRPAGHRTASYERILPNGKVYRESLDQRNHPRIADSYPNRYRLLLERVQAAHRRQAQRQPGLRGMGLLARHLLPRHVSRIRRPHGGEEHQEIRTRLHGLLRGRLRRHGREHRPELPAGRVHLLWRDHGHRPGRRLSDSGQEPDALVRRQQGPRHRHRRRRLRPGQGHRQPVDGVPDRHGGAGQHVLHPRRDLCGDDVLRFPAHQASG